MWPKRLLSDGQLVGRVLGGRTNDFSVLIERYGNAVHAVAYAQVATHTDAEDAAQEAFLKAYTSLDTLRDRNRFGPWLIAIARNCALGLLRSRGRAERAKGAGEVATPPRDFEGEELRALLRMKVMELEEGPREVLLLHYYAGKNVREMAALLGITTEAAKKRLQRARETLSERLAGEIGQWLGSAEPSRERKPKIMAAIFATAPDWKQGAAAGTGLGMGVFGGTMLKAGVAAVVAGLVILPSVQWALRSGSMGAAETGEPAVHSSFVTQADIGEADSSVDIAPGPARTAVAQEPSAVNAVAPVGATITGRVYNVATKHGLVDARLIIVNKEDAARVADVITDIDGVFRAEGLEPGTYTVRCDQSIYPPVLSTVERIVTVRTEETANVDFPLAPGIRVAGSVIGPDGQAVAQARVHAMTGSMSYSVATKSQGDGRFELFLPEVGPDVQMGASNESHESQVLGPFEVEASGQDGIVLRLAVARDSGFSGKVVDAASKPVEGASVHPQRGVADFLLSNGFETTEADGSFALTGLAPGEYGIAVTAPGIDGWSERDQVADLKLSAGEHKIKVRLVLGGEKTGGRIAGRVVDSEGKGIGGVEVLANGAPDESAYTADDGSFSLTLLDPGTYTISAHRSRTHTSPSYTPINVPDVETGTDDLRIVLMRGGTVAGRVVDAGNGLPLPEFEVFLRWPGGVERITDSALINPETYASPDGQFSRTSHSGVVTVTARAKGYAPGMINTEIFEDEVSEVEFRLLPSAVVSGRVVDVHGNPISDARIFLGPVPLQTLEDSPVMARTDAAGTFTLDSIRPDLSLISVQHRNYAPLWAPLEHEAVYTLTSGGTVTGRVRMGDEILDNVWVGFDHLDEPRLRCGANTNGAGEFAFYHVVPGNIQVELTLDARSFRTLAQVSDGAATDVTIDIPAASCAVEGVVSCADAPEGTLVVRLLVDTGAGVERREFRTDIGNSYRFEDLPAGSVHMVATLQRESGTIFRTGADTFDLAEGQTARRDIVLGGTCAVAGSVGADARYQSASVWLFYGALATNASDFDACFRRNHQCVAAIAKVENGAYSIDHLSAGEYTVVATGRPWDYDDLVDALPFAAATVVVDENAPACVDFELP